uniref:39S ribosomal protein L28, mitochondrial n=1 Tax=Euleptes europaea TaxID=460621 RepID=UPI00253F9BBF|nr:39S ribosomal protein L28, mitochondrial [Euleptes europaea]
MGLHAVPPRLWWALRLRSGVASRLPEHYLRALRRDRDAPPPAVHWRPRPPPPRLDPATGRRRRGQDVPVPAHLPPRSQQGLWGGEGWVVGFRYARGDKLSARVKKIWKPQLFSRQLYSEILDRRLTVTVTMRTLDLIDAAFGFDRYILKTPKEELCSKLGMDLKRTMLLRLVRRDPALHPDDPAKREAVYEKYKEFVIPEEEAEWVGLSLEEAIEKQRLREKKDPVPLFKVYVEELVQQLQEQKLSDSATRQANQVEEPKLQHKVKIATSPSSREGKPFPESGKVLWAASAMADGENPGQRAAWRRRQRKPMKGPWLGSRRERPGALFTAARRPHPLQGHGLPQSHLSLENAVVREMQRERSIHAPHRSPKAFWSSKAQVHTCHWWPERREGEATGVADRAQPEGGPLFPCLSGPPCLRVPWHYPMTQLFSGFHRNAT